MTTYEPTDAEADLAEGVHRANRAGHVRYGGLVHALSRLDLDVPGLLTRTEEGRDVYDVGALARHLDTLDGPAVRDLLGRSRMLAVDRSGFDMIDVEVALTRRLEAVATSDLAGRLASEVDPDRVSEILDEVAEARSDLESDDRWWHADEFKAAARAGLLEREGICRGRLAELASTPRP